MLTDREWNKVTLLFAGAMGAYLALYLTVFYLCARMTFQLSERLSPPRRVVVQVTLLFIVFCLSFLRVNRGSGLVAETSAYSVWECVARYWKRR
jgi:hypothetical protein